MPTELEIRVADDADRRAALANAWEFWGHGLRQDEYIERRLKSPLYSRARRYVGVIDGQVIVALACYDREFYWQGTVVPGIAIGSVHTRPENRGRGLAAELLDEVARQNAQQGARFAVLYCDIDTHYYGRRGYQVCPSWQATAEVRAGVDSTPVEGGWRLAEFSAEEGLDGMARLYASDHGRLPWAVARSRAYWEFALEYQALDDFFWLEDPRGRRGYVRMGRGDNTWKFVDWAIDEPDPRQRERAEAALYRQVLLEAQYRGYAQCGGWLPASAMARAAFQLAPRREEITMVRPLDPQLWFDEPALEAANRLVYLDHV